MKQINLTPVPSAGTAGQAPVTSPGHTPVFPRGATPVKWALPFINVNFTGHSGAPIAGFPLRYNRRGKFFPSMI